MGGKVRACPCLGGWLFHVQVQTLFPPALKDERFQLEEFSPRRVRIRLSDARLEDEGGYFCQLYTEDTHHQIATLTVLGTPLPRAPLSCVFSHSLVLRPVRPGSF